MSQCRPLVLCAALEFRRSLSQGPTLLYLLVLLLLARASQGNLPFELGVESEAVQAALARESLATGTLLWCVPWLCLHAAGTISRWRHREGGFWGASAMHPLRLACSTSLAWGASALLLLALSAALCLALHGFGPISLRYAGGQSLLETVRLEAGEERVLELTPPPRPAGLKLSVHMARTVGRGRAYANEAAEVELLLSRAAPAERSVHASVHTRERVEIELPPGTGPVQLQLKHCGGASLALLAERTIEYWEPGPRAGWAVLELYLRVAVALLAACALSFGLGGWMNRAIASALVLSLWLAASRSGAARAWLPAARIWRDLEHLRQGRLSESLDWRWPLAAVGLWLCGVGLATLGLRSWAKLR